MELLDPEFRIYGSEESLGPGSGPHDSREPEDPVSGLMSSGESFVYVLDLCLSFQEWFFSISFQRKRAGE